MSVLRPHDVLRATDFMILEALGKLPMTTRELSLATQVSAHTITKKLKRLEENNLVMRGMGKKWHASFVVWVASAKDVAEGINGEKVVYTPPVEPSPIVESGNVPRNAQEGPQEAHSEAKRTIPTAVPPPPEPKPYRPPKTRQVVSERAEKMSKRMNIPPYLEGRGEVSMGQVMKCQLCVRTTPIKYGEDSVCPMCARGGK